MSAAVQSVRPNHLHLVRQPDDQLSNLRAPPGLERVEAAMRQLAQTYSTHASTMVLEHLDTGGKRLRARLALAATTALGGSVESGVWWAAAVELLHNATLIHDDIQDGDRTRRGRPTVWSQHGVPQAMNAGDLMLMLPYLAVSRIADPVVGSLSQAVAEHAIRTVCGQVDEIDLPQHEALSFAAYRHAIAGKTGALLGLPIYGAALLAGRSRGQARRLSDAFCELGVMFQLQDDVLDLYGDKGRDVIGSDLYEGKISALVIAHLERRPHDKAWLLGLLHTPRERTDPAEVLHAIDAFKDSGALDDTLGRIDRIAAATRDDGALCEEPALQVIAEGLVELALNPIAHCRRRSEP